jgi:hypothetical protein
MRRQTAERPITISYAGRCVCVHVLMCEPKRDRRRGVEMCVFVFCVS